MVKHIRSEAARKRRKVKDRTRRAILRARSRSNQLAPGARELNQGVGEMPPPNCAEVDSQQILSSITDGTAKASECSWGNLRSNSPTESLDPRPELVRIREFFDTSVEKLVKLEAGLKLNEWIRLSRDQQERNQQIWSLVTPKLMDEADVLRKELCEFLQVDCASVEGCDVQVGLLRSMLLATQEVDEMEDVELLDEILKYGGVNIGVETPVKRSGWWPESRNTGSPENSESLSHFASDSWKNYTSAELMEDSLMEYYDDEVRKGFMEDWQSLPTGAVVSRIAAIEKKNGGIRVIDDLRRSGVNALVSTEETIELPGASSTALILQRIREYQASHGEYDEIVWIETDVASAFRHIPIRPCDRKFCVNCINSPSGQRFIAHRRLPFGLRSSPLLWVRPCASEARLAKRIFAHAKGRAEGLQLYIDDKNYFCALARALHRLLGLLLLDAVLGIKNSLEKVRVSQEPVILGFQWDLKSDVVGVATPKAETILRDIECLLRESRENKRVSVPLLKTVTGRLSWMCHVAKLLKPKLRSLYACKTVAERLNCRTIALSQEAKADLEFFLATLKEELSGQHVAQATSLARIPSSFLLGWGSKLGGFSHESDVTVVISDSSTSAFGGLVIGEGKAFWYRFELENPCSSRVSRLVEPSNWSAWESSDICSLELLAVLCGCMMAMADRPVIILCDNASAVAAVNKLAAKSPRLNSLLKALASSWGYSRGLKAYHLPTEDNWLADFLSRRSLGDIREHMVGACMSEIDTNVVLDQIENYAALS